MNNRVHRNQLQVKPDPQSLLLGAGKIVHVAEDRQGLGRIDIWYEFDSAHIQKHASTFYVVGTGGQIPDECDHIGTVIMKDGLVWHVYRKFECPVC